MVNFRPTITDHFSFDVDRASINSSEPAATGLRTDHLSKKAVGTTMVVQ